jgi:glycyl-tRNA synthetase
MQKNKKLLDDLLKRRNVFFQGFEIYGGVAGLYDFGPVGCSIKTSIEQIWREHFVMEEEMLEINTTCITPHVVLEHSGHVSRFTDLLVKDVKTGTGHRADKLLAEWLDNKLEKGKLKEAEAEEFKKILVNVDNYSKEEMAAIFKKLQIKSPETGNELSDPEPFNLMFKTEIGPSTNLVGYLRPETAQGMFVNFNKLLEFNGGRLPFAAAQIGLGFRNEIAPRNGLVRVREFQMAEIEHFVDPQNKKHPKFKRYANMKLPLYSAAHQ